ncbi:MAG: hypothetical protein AVDCRST_MAG26-1409 [uncultured Chloroflexia bacterium]|uniref:EF-hand domain-containing protein n=1 Tax=uncultured Chloroflexia bacterium TaxID=1672391 RepID=A0A6J4I426_9CHLR|nr:MAG: hypothetical protein AVDCRST_MAG26-1409 [uncultured Chloroflexia bacterium]
MKMHVVVLVVLLAALGLGSGMARAQEQTSTVTPEACQTYVDRYGTPAGDAAITFQGGSMEAQQVAFCLSLSFRAGRDGTSLEQAFSALADTNQDRAVDVAELESYFLAARNGEPALAGSPTVDSARSPATPEPAAPVAAGGVSGAAGAGDETAAGEPATVGSSSDRQPLILGAIAIVAVAAGLAAFRGLTGRRRA